MTKVLSLLVYLATAFNVIWIAYILRHVCIGKENRRKRIDFIRSYKKGNCTVAFIPYFFLHLTGALYTKTIAAEASLNVTIAFESFFDSLAKTLLLAGLRFDTGSIQKYMEAWRFYKVSIYLAFSLVVFNAALFVCSFLNQRISFRRASARRLRKVWVKENTCFIFGNNPRNVTVYGSDKANGYPVKYIVDSFGGKGDDGFFSRGIRYANYQEEKKEAEYLKKYLNFKDKDQKELVMIINFEDDEKNLSLCNSLLGTIRDFHFENEKYDATTEPIPKDTMSKEERQKKELKEKLDRVSIRLSKVSIYVFGDGTKDSLFYELEREGFGVIHYMNKYRYIGQGFLWDNPLVRYMDKRHIDYGKALLLPGFKASFSLVGFGKINRELFSNLVTCNQFATEDENGNPVPLQMDYYLYDKNENIFSKDLNYGYFRYEKFYHDNVGVNEDKYLPLAPLPANVIPVEDCDINSPEFFESLQKSMYSSDKHLNFVFVSYGEDLENAELAEKIAQLGRDWKIANLKVFVRMKHPRSNRFLVEKSNVHVYGDEDEVYSLDKILSKTILKLGMLTDVAYQMVSADNAKKADSSVEDMLMGRYWYATRYNIDRISSCYSGINVKNRLGLMNFMVTSSLDDEPVTEEAFNSIYQPQGKDSVIRRNLMFMEHMRWNAFMICNGYVPSTRTQILEPSRDGGIGKKGKCHEERRHGNLTTYDGLDEFVRILHDKFGVEMEELDVKKYDAMFMDKCPALFPVAGLGIRKRHEWEPVKEDLTEMLNDIKLVLKHLRSLAISYSFVDRMVPEQADGDLGYVFDVDIRVEDDGKEYSAEELNDSLGNAIDYIGQFHGYEPSECDSGLITIKHVDSSTSEVLYSCRFAISDT